jgi:hypothetical protein
MLCLISWCSVSNPSQWRTWQKQRLTQFSSSMQEATPFLPQPFKGQRMMRELLEVFFPHSPVQTSHILNCVFHSRKHRNVHVSEDCCRFHIVCVLTSIHSCWQLKMWLLYWMSISAVFKCVLSSMFFMYLYLCWEVQADTQSQVSSALRRASSIILSLSWASHDLWAPYSSSDLEMRNIKLHGWLIFIWGEFHLTCALILLSDWLHQVLLSQLICVVSVHLLSLHDHFAAVNTTYTFLW